MTMRPVQQHGGNVTDIKKKAKIEFSKEGISSFLMMAGAIGSGLGAGFAWSAGVGVFAGCVMLYMTGVLLGIG